MLISRDCILSSVNGVFNAIMVKGDQTGDVMFYGKGAGKEATASAVVADIIDCVKHLNARKYLSWEDGSEDYVDNTRDNPVRLYIRITSENYNRLTEQFNSIFGADVWNVKNEYRGEIAFITDEEKESVIKEKLDRFTDITAVKILHTML